MSPLAATCFLIAFAAVFGGAIGSFLNVVVYRLPNGLSLCRPPSHCPKCKTPIRWFDNVPVFGWIMLGGRCRACRCWIPIRYPAVEAFCAVMFAALVAVENPLAADLPHLAFLFGLLQLILFCTLLCAALIEMDGNRPPARLFFPTIAASVLAAFFFQPAIQSLRFPVRGYPCCVEDVFLGFGVAIFWAVLAWLIFRKTLAPALGLLCVGLTLGWQAVVAVALATFLIHLALLPGPCGKIRRFAPPCMLLLIFALAWIFILSFSTSFADFCHV